VCNDFGNNVPYSDYLAAFSQIRAPVVFPTAAPNLEPRHDIWPTEVAPVFRRRDDGVEMLQLRWGFPPARPKGVPISSHWTLPWREPDSNCCLKRGQRGLAAGGGLRDAIGRAARKWQLRRWHCQLRRPWYARSVGARRLGSKVGLLAYRSARFKQSGAAKGALGPLS
jgi:hypothetical protein